MNLAEHTNTLDGIFARNRVLPFISIRRAEHVLPLADALAAGGITTLEITLRTPLGLAAIARLRQGRPGLCIGGGTGLPALAA